MVNFGPLVNYALITTACTNREAHTVLVEMFNNDLYLVATESYPNYLVNYKF